MKHFCPHENCGASFPRPSKLATHIKKIHLKEPLFKCPYQDCGKDYTQAAHLKRHVQIIHERKNSNSDSYLFQCGVLGCNKKFSTMWGLVRHHEVHCQDKKFKCSKCPVTFHLERLLSKHMVEHTGKARFECEKCPLNFNDYNKFCKHQKQTHAVHLCKRPGCESLQFDNYKMLRKHECSIHQIKLQCAYCSKQFARRLHLAEHITSEHECITFNCTYEGCDKTFSYKRNLKSHIRLHHKNNRFMCEECGKGLSTNQKLKEHIKRLHQGGSKARKNPQNRAKSEVGQILGLYHKHDKLINKEAESLKRRMSNGNLPVEG